MRTSSALVAATALVLLAGCRGYGGTAAAPTAPATTPAPVSVQVSPANGATDVSPRVPLEISVASGELTGVHVVDSAGAEVAGAVADPSGNPAVDVWTPDAPLAYGASYTLTARAEGADAEPAEAATTFTTVTPEALGTPSIGPLDGQTVGVGMPIRVWSEEPVTDRAAVERALRVTSSTPTDGVWSWFSDTEVHFRPSEYWPENTDVTLDAALFGVHFGGGVWGEKDRTVSFRIGERHVSVADASTYRMEVYDGEPWSVAQQGRENVATAASTCRPRTPAGSSSSPSPATSWRSAAPMRARCARTSTTGPFRGWSGRPAARWSEPFPQATRGE